MWEDPNAKERRHKLMTKELAATVPTIGTYSNAPGLEETVAPVKLFCPYSSWTWFITEWEADTGRCFGVVAGDEFEAGFFDLDTLAAMKIRIGDVVVPAIERDKFYEPTTVGQIRREYGK